MMQGIVYKITNLINGKIYIGQDSKNNPNYLGSGTLIQKALQKFGKENFKKETLEICETQEQLNSNEEYYIELHNSTNPQLGYNIIKKAFGLHEGFKYPQEWRDNMKQTRIFKNPKERKNKISEKLLGKAKSTEARLNIKLGHFKLSEKQFKEILSLLKKKNIKSKQIAIKFKVSTSLICQIKNNNSPYNIYYNLWFQG